MRLYENIREYRKANGWSQEELAKRTGYTDRSSIAKIEKGQVDLTQSKINLFAKVFGVSPVILMGLQDETDLKAEISAILDRLDQTKQAAVLEFLRSITEEHTQEQL